MRGYALLFSLLLLFILPPVFALAVSPGGFTLPPEASRVTLTLRVLTDPGVTVLITPEGALADYMTITPSMLTTPGWHTVHVNITIPPDVPRDARLLITTRQESTGMLNARAGLIIPISTPRVRILLQKTMTGIPSVIILTAKPLPVTLRVMKNESVVWQMSRTYTPRDGRIIIPLNVSLPYDSYTLHVTAGNTTASYTVLLGTPQPDVNVRWQSPCLALLTIRNPLSAPLRIRILSPEREDLGLLPGLDERTIPLETCEPGMLRVWVNGHVTSIPLQPPVQAAQPRTQGFFLTLLILAAVLLLISIITR